MVTHKHHIIPKHMGGTDEPSNLVEVSIEKHAELHRQLWEDLGHWQDKIAWLTLSGQITIAEAIKETQRQYMKNRVVTAETRLKMADATRNRIRIKGHPMQGKKFSEESKKKMSLSHQGQVGWSKGLKLSEERCEVNRQAQLKRKKLECPECGQMVSGGGNLRQHLERHSRKISK